jgi:hypothetical protein
MEDCNPDRIESRINFTKRELVGGVIHELTQYQQQPYALKQSEELGLILSHTPLSNKDFDKSKWNQSKLLE